MRLLATLLAHLRSGAVYPIHTHCRLQRGPEYDAEGLPSTFSRLIRSGSTSRQGGHVRIDSGDVVQSR
jgi:hypothetical protein